MTMFSITSVLAWCINDAAYALLDAAGRLEPGRRPARPWTRCAPPATGWVRWGRRDALHGLS